VAAYPSDDGKALLLVLRRRPFRPAWVERLAPVWRERRIELDGLGSWVWRTLDGQRCVGQVVELFSVEFAVNRREAEVAVTEFLASLMKRGLIAMQIPRQP
jgi:hypothetical protein